MIDDITYLGNITQVDSSSIVFEILEDIISSNPIINGRLYKIGQIGTFIKIPLGNIVLYAIISAVSNVPINTDDEEIKNDSSSRFLTADLIGEKIGNNKFERGIGTYPTVNDEVHLVIEEDLKNIYGNSEEGGIEIGTHSSSENLPIYCDLHNFILRHSAVLGSTGSGKSNTTVTIIKDIINNYDNSRMILIDPHGEYSSAFPDAKIFKINDEENPLHIPFWLMNYDELAYFLVGAKPSDDNDNKYREFRDIITEKKKECSEMKCGSIDKNLITADSPIPFDIREVWGKMNWWVNATFKNPGINDQTEDTVCSEKEGDYQKLIPAKFMPYSPNTKVPYKSKHGLLYSYEKKIFHRLKDSRFDFLFKPGVYEKAVEKDLDNLLEEWIGNDEKLTILDLSGVPFAVLDMVIGLITRFIYDSMFWGRNKKFTGKKRPLLMIYEEAHSYLNKNDDSNYSRKSVEKIFKEGRKFGIGALIISQRPSEISETILAQVGTFISLKLTNSADQNIVKSLAPDNLNSLIDLLPSLRIGEAVIVGESIKIPSRVKIGLNTPRPTSDDPNLIKHWKKKFKSEKNKYNDIINNMRKQNL